MDTEDADNFLTAGEKEISDHILQRESNNDKEASPASQSDKEDDELEEEIETGYLYWRLLTQKTNRYHFLTYLSLQGYNGDRPRA